MSIRASNKWFIQDWGTYPSETLVVVGLTTKQILAGMKRRNFHQDVITAFENSKEEPTANAWVWYWDDRSVLWFKEWRNDWEHANTLLHETNHLIYHKMRSRGMENEMEAQAYQHEYLFDRIRRRLCAKPKRKK